MMRILKFITTAVLLMCALAVTAQEFNHPGLLQTNEDLARIRTAIRQKVEPVYSAFIVFAAHPQSQYTYQIQGPLTLVGRNPTVGQAIYDADANAAYQNALMWTLTNDRRYAEKSIEIIDKWSSTLKSITGRDAVLMAGLGPFKMVNAAEILRYTSSGWSNDAIKIAERQFREVVYPVIENFAPFANGNWDSAALKTMMAIAVFTNDRKMFEKSLRYYEAGGGDGSLLHYIVNDEGQCQESGRDQGHTQLGIAHLADCAEIAWHQGLDLYGFASNRLLKGFEYTAKYNLGMEVPYVPLMDRTGKYLHEKISVEGRGKLRAVYEEVYNHYVKCVGLPAPYTMQAAEKIRPEPQGQPGADHVGFGTLLYSRFSADNCNAMQSSSTQISLGLIAASTSNGVKLTWTAVRNAVSYRVARSESSGGDFKVLDKRVINNSYTDGGAVPGKLYYYKVLIITNKRGAKVSEVVSLVMGLPKPWKVDDVNSETSGNHVDFDGRTFFIEAGGAGALKSGDHFVFVNRPFEDGAVTINYDPELTAQSGGFGLAIRNNGYSRSAEVALLLMPLNGARTESPKWVLQLSGRQKKDDSLTTFVSSSPLNEPIVTYGRLTGRCMLRIKRTGNQVSGFYSSDGLHWVDVGYVKINLNANARAGIIVYSGIPAMTTTVKIDPLFDAGGVSSLEKN